MDKAKKTERVQLLFSEADITEFNRWQKKNKLRSRAQAIRLLSRAGAHLDHEFGTVKEIERLALATRGFIQAAVKIRLTGGTDADKEQLITGLVEQYPESEKAIDAFSELVRDLGLLLHKATRRHLDDED